MATIYDPLRAARLRAVGTRFLRLRPLVATVGVGINSALLLSTDVPRAQILPAAFLSWGLVAAFYLEALWVTRRALTERWLLASLVLTAGALGGGCAVTGGLSSPLLPLVFAPIVIAFAAFARGRGVWVVSATAIALVGLLGADPFARWMAPPVPQAGWMALTSMAVSLVLVRIGVAGLSDAFQAAGEGAARMRTALLEDAAARAKEAEAMGARVAHEVRNPLTSIKGLVQLLAKAAQGRDAERARVVLEEVDRVDAILSDYLAFARPLVELELSSAAIERLVADVGELVESTCADSGVALVVDAQPVSGVVDARRLRQALLNLIRNALAAMPEGGHLRLVCASSEGQIELRVEDDGEGMDARTLAQVGTPYFTTRAEGTGLGVTLARSVARQHGGTLTFESELGQGTCAIVRIPIAAAEAA